MEVDLIIHNARQLVTCSSNGKAKKGRQMQDIGIIENGAVAVKDGVIAAVGKSDKVLREFKAENAVDANQQVICPAFVECHTHLVFAGNRLDEFELKIKGADYLEILEAGGGILSTVKKTHEACLAELVEQSQKRLDKMLELGVTTCEVKTGYGLNLETELKMLDAIAELDKIHPIDIIPTFLGAHAVSPEFKGREDEFINLICEEMLPVIADVRKCELNFKGTFKNKPFFVDVFCEKNAFNLEQSKKVLLAAKGLGFGLKAHVDEFTNLGCARFAIENGATSIDHLDATSEEEIALLAKSKTIGVITPTVNFNFGSCEFADARKMIDAGCAIALSTDFNPGSAPCPSLPFAMAIACRYQKLLPSEALNAVTINAAFAVGWSEKIGSIEVGKQADILVLDTNDYRQIAYEFGSNAVEQVIKKGKLIIDKNE
ncbi:MAG: imidazolonepropionase [Acidobacteria bacterium]|nr:imidazolonepropionase [Acidobacteriota bacterium]